jgi:hypothetical protein
LLNTGLGPYQNHFTVVVAIFKLQEATEIIDNGRETNGWV